MSTNLCASVYDNLSSGLRHEVPNHAEFIEGDVTDKVKINLAMNSTKPDAVIHFAALIEVEESVREPLKSYQTKVYGRLCVLEACANNRVPKFVFSSTAAVYGDASLKPMAEIAKTPT